MYRRCIGVKHDMEQIYNQIHAPRELVLQTKEDVHKAMEHKTRNPDHRKIWVIREAMAVACVLVVVTTIWFVKLGEEPSWQGEKIKIPMGQTKPIQSIQLESVESFEQFLSVLKEVERNEDKSHTLLKNYTISTGMITSFEKNYEIALFVKNGILDKNNSCYSLSGTLVATVKKEDGTVKEFELGRLNHSTQFTKETTGKLVVQTREDNNQMFLLYEKEKQVCYTVSKEGNIIEIKD